MDDIGCLAYPLEQGFVYANLTLAANIVPFLSRQALAVQKIARIHKIPISSHWNLTKNLKDLVDMFEGHSSCINCTLYKCVLKVQLSPSLIRKDASAKAFADLTEEKRSDSDSEPNKTKQTSRKKTKGSNSISKHAVDPIPSPPAFPPPPLTKELSETIIQQWPGCRKETKLSWLEESGCAVCGELVPISWLSRLKSVKKMLWIVLAAPGVTQTERKSASQKISEFHGPVLD